MLLLGVLLLVMSSYIFKFLSFLLLRLFLLTLLWLLLTTVVALLAALVLIAGVVFLVADYRESGISTPVESSVPPCKAPYSAWQR